MADARDQGAPDTELRGLRLAGAWLAAILFAAVFIPLRLKNSIVPPDLTITFRAEAPFQHRLLVSMIVRGLLSMGETVASHRDALYVWIDAAAVVGALVALQTLLVRRGRSPWWVAVTAVMLFANFVYGAPRILVMLGGEVVDIRANFVAPYDMTTLLFFTVGMLAIHDRRWPLYYGMLPVAILNRETAALLIVVFAAVQFSQMERRRWVMALIAQVAILAVIKLSLIAIFAGNGGTAASFAGLDRHGQEGVRAIQNLAFLLSAEAAPIFGFLWLPWILAWVRTRDRFVRRSSLAIPCFLVPMFLVGNFYEFRIFTEILPLITLIIATGLPEWLQHRVGQPAV